MKTTEMLTRNIAKSGEVLNWGSFSPFQLYLGLIEDCSQSATCHIATVGINYKEHFTKHITWVKN